MSYKEEFIKFMLNSGVMTFGEFKTKSGRLSPYFINTGRYKTGSQIARLGEFYGNCIIDNVKNGNIKENISTLFGPAYKGIPISVATSIALSNKCNMDLNICFDRKEAKSHGEGGTIIGYPMKEGDSILIIDDVITAGTAMRESIEKIKAVANVNIEGLIISVNRMEKGETHTTATEEIEKEFGIKTYSIVNIVDILEFLRNDQTEEEFLINEEMRMKMEDHIKTYCL